MSVVVFTFGVAMTADGSQSSRLMALMNASFQLGPAWHGGQSAVFVKTELSLEQAFRHVLGAREAPHDLIIAIEIATGAVRWSGNRFDEEGFDALFPDAVELPG